MSGLVRPVLGRARARRVQEPVQQSSRNLQPPLPSVVRHRMPAVRSALSGVVPARALSQPLRSPLHSLQGALPLGVPTQEVPVALLPTVPALPETLPQEASQLLAPLPRAVRRSVRLLRLREEVRASVL